LKKILTIIGARPQFIKAAPVSRALRERGGLREVLVHTGQHYDANMSQVFFDELEIPAPHFNLGVGSGGHGEQTGEMLKRLEPLMVSQKPDLVLVYGDTNSTLAGALVASKLRMLVAHAEAGLRSFNRSMPEEINRVVADHLSTLLFCPTKTAVLNLKKEGIAKNVFTTGDVMYDAALMFSKKAEQKSNVLSRLGLQPKRYILATVHRPENTDDKNRLANIFAALEKLAEDTTVVFPLHPRTKKMAQSFSLAQRLSKVKVIEPAGFLDMIRLESNASLIVTDSGGVQKEAYFHRVPCVTLRKETEWVETVEAGWNTLAKDLSQNAIAGLARKMMVPDGTRKTIREYGDGKAAGKMAGYIGSWAGRA
jgi:UDP-N-acetylglucosamine 2-epimerase